MGPSGSGKNYVTGRMVGEARSRAIELSYFDVDWVGRSVKGEWEIDIAQIPSANIICGTGEGMQNSRHMKTHLKVVVVPSWETFTLANLAKALEKHSKPECGGRALKRTWIEGWLNAFRYTFDEYSLAFTSWIETSGVTPDAIYYSEQSVVHAFDPLVDSGWDRSLSSTSELDRNTRLLARQAGDRIKAANAKLPISPSSEREGAPTETKPITETKENTV
jgi:hypothetical protein